MANYEATRYDYDGANLTGIEGVNVGIILPWSDSTAPSGFLECDGSAVSRTTYAGLFAVVGTTYGSGDGSTTFNLPDFSDRTCVSNSPTKSLASTGGANTVATAGNANASVGNKSITNPLTASHNHPINGVQYNAQTGGSGSVIGTSPSRGGNGSHNHPASANYTGSATSVLQPYLTLIYIIKT